MVTVTGVDLSPDLKPARVFVSVLGDAAARERSLQGLASARPHLQSQVGKRVGLRFTPELRFALDPSFETGEGMEHLLRELHPPDAALIPAATSAEAGVAPALPPAQADAAARRGRSSAGAQRARAGRRPGRGRDGDRDGDT